MMDFASVNVVLLDERVSNDRFESGVCASSTEPKELLDDIRSLLTVFKGGKFLAAHTPYVIQSSRKYDS